MKPTIRQLNAALLLAAALWPGTAYGQSIQALTEELKADAAKLPALNQVMAQTTDGNIALNKEYQITAADQKRQAEDLKKALDRQQRTVKAPLEQKIAEETEAYNAHCAESRVGKLPPKQYQDCLTRKMQTEKEVAAQRQQWSEHAARWNAENVAPVNEKIAKQNARMAQISDEMKANVKRFTEAQDKFLALRQRIEQDLAALKRLCNPLASAAGTPLSKAERMKHCASIDVQSYRKSLPPIYSAKGVGGTAGK
jgi:hypothetical protein